MSKDYPHAVLTSQYYILGPRFDDVSTVKVNFFLELNLQTPTLNWIYSTSRSHPHPPAPSNPIQELFFSEKVLEWSTSDKFQIEMEKLC